MSFADEYHRLACTVAERLALPRLSGLQLPNPVEEAEKADEFGFVFLEDGSAGPFYTSLDDTLPELWKLYPDGGNVQGNVLELIEHFRSQSQVLRSVALGAFNAISQHVFERAGFSPVKASTTKSQPAPGQLVAIVGYIRPMVERLLEKGHPVLVLEKNPARVELQPGVTLSTDPRDLRSSDFIICTASTLINDSLGEILHYKRASAHLSLVGPSGSGLPDVLFAHGVDDVGGIAFHDIDALKASLVRQESWGHAGDKYQLSTAQYPGIDRLLAAIQQNQP